MTLNLKQLDKKYVPCQNPSAIIQFWNQQHAENNVQFLTGSSGQGTWEDLQITDRVIKGANVLNIGVGLGYCTKALVEAGCNVHALDISPVALAKVKDIVDATWLPLQYDEMPVNFFNLVISYLVTQHMCLDDFIEQIKYVVRSLCCNGIFAMQFASRLIFEEVEITEQRLQFGGVCYPVRKIVEIVEDVGGKILWLKHSSVFPHYGSEWYFVHVGRAVP
jgi:cyclopropane fatty-acyl-phospholipid synthase-like methyltransferase